MLRDYDTGAWSVRELCEVYGVSRETFYVLRARRASGDLAWFCGRSHVAASCPHRTPAAVALAVAAVRRRFPRFGPKKVKAWLERTQPGTVWPAASTIGDILKREGLVTARSRRRRGRELGQAETLAQEPNDEWACDFKGWFRTRNGMRCDPLTITGTTSRYLIEVRITEPTTDGVRPVFRRVFEEQGLPAAIRCDNGPPFGSQAAGGLTRLSVWWLKLGIAPHFIRPASPQDNGRHERMHRTLKADTAKPPCDSLAEQQVRFDAFRAHYNDERPHEAIDQPPPAALWRPSPRPMPKRLLEPWYDPDHQVRRVRSSGEIKWNGGLVFLSEPLIGETVGLAELPNGTHIVRFFDIDLGLIDRQGLFRRFAPLRHRLRYAPEDPNQQILSGINPV
ncbi:MAG: integrase core domain-containing protein [Phenylobacterium sp.]|uniref:integrase core domain-containing protein n=1 Tax=Phenylobacterium sp. TaxID=1871053 RepID=UPI0027362F04|nr:integrase core domain-containing protein [Phenylobacterium sp.]MDP3747548.1 integrase core domain-containing protein [Phenylobacterium sp.]